MARGGRIPPDAFSVAAIFEDGVLVLRPRDLPGIDVRRRRDGDQLVWSYATLFTTRMERVNS